MDHVREQLLDEVKKSFVGPRDKADPLPKDNMPFDMYTSGILFPSSAPQDEFDKEEKDNVGDLQENQQNHEESEKFFKQNSIGIRVELKKGTKKIKLEVGYGKYLRDEKGIWRRHEIDDAHRKHVLDLSKSTGEIHLLDNSDTAEAKIWWKLYNGNVLNVFLENTRPWTDPDDKKNSETSKNEESVDYMEAQKRNNENSIFQPIISLQSHDDSPAFLPVESRSASYKSAEDDLFDMLYRNKKIFGSGYGCAVEWEDGDYPRYVQTVIIPTFQDDEIAKYADDDNDPIRPSKIDMYDLCCFKDLDDHENNRKTIASKLSPLIDKYEKWILQQKNSKQKQNIKQYDEIAKNNLEKCREILNRMKDGYRLLTDNSEDKDNKILKSFILTNRAMLYQRLHFKYALSKFKNKKVEWPDPKERGRAFWFPFQLAFVLMSIRGIAFKDHPDSSTADLIWFPTGGGKTEAYLGIAAFTMILRRLRRVTEDGLGVSVIMRYTLRLLTLQQFERASTLMCALEFLRRKHASDDLGAEPFLLGLWVGHSLTPNAYQSSKSALQHLKDNPSIAPPDGSPCQTNYCPWCGHRMMPDKNYKFDKETKWTLTRCSNDSSPCIFTDRTFAPDKILPLVTVDSDIYTRCPSMIIATVDKFARMPFRSDIANIFGRPSRKCALHGFQPREKHSNCGIEGEGAHKKTSKARVRRICAVFPPDLIIQDELHLISGPLGTMVGLYETAVDFLTQTTVGKNCHRPKVIVSTATIKGAQDQVRKIFDRSKTTAFPPPGTDRKDSFFWWETGKKGKLFVGVSFSHRSAKFALAKLYASLLQKMSVIYDSLEMNDEETDPYWTLVGYYNSIRELGGANRLVEDDVVKNMQFMAKTLHQDQSKLRDLGTPGNGIDELTGRKTQREINDIRDKLEKSLPDEDVISVLLATNMISVGIDIDRLALMVVNGQPKTITEYIQATGRIGRRENYPGIVLVLYNPYKSRDLSQYENFGGFHRIMQKHVEPSTLTPFSIPAYERGLHAVLFSMIRLSNPRLASNPSADDFEIDDGEDATNFILERFKSVEQTDEGSDSFKAFKRRLDALQEEWCKFIKYAEEDDSSLEPVWYSNPPNKWDVGKSKNPNVLMIEFAKHGKQKSGTFPLSTAESLRDVEQQIEMEYV